MERARVQPREANCRPIVDFVSVLQKRGADLSRLCEGLPVTLDDLRDPSTWLDWDTTTVLYERFEALTGGDDPWMVLSSATVLRPSGWPVLQLAVGPISLYRVAALYLARHNFPIHTADFEVQADGWLRIQLHLPEDRPGSLPWMNSARAVYVVLPRLLGLPDAEVKADLRPHHSEFRVRPPESRSAWARFRRGARLALRSDRAVDELIQREADLRRSHEQLVQTHEALKGRERDLVQEVEERRRTEQLLSEREDQLARSQKLEVVGHLAGGIAHDFNNMLMAVTGCAELLRAHVDDSDEATEIISELEGAVDRAALLTSQLLAFSRGEHTRPRRLDVCDVIRAQAKVLRRLVTGARLEIHMQPDLPPVHMDPSQLQQVILNLVVNARDAMPDGGEIWLSVSEDAHGVRLTVTDTGPGIPADMHARVFEPFFTTKGDHGTGLGLATVHSIVDRTGGRVWIDPDYTEGARLHVTLPTVEGAPDPMLSTSPDDLAAGGDETVLLVEDDPVLRRVLFSTLDRAGYRTFTAAGLAEVRRVLGGLEGPLDLVVTDFLLEADRGTDVIEVVRARDPEVPCIVLSGFVDPAHHAEVRPHAFLAKPFAPPKLLALVRRVLDAGQG